jgi:hypothetical protein
MKLIFNRDEDVIVTKLEIDGDTQDFNYLTFINKLIDGEEVDDTVYPTDITNDEKKEIESMIQKINETISIQNEGDEEANTSEVANSGSGVPNDSTTEEDEIPF